jgi:hypothetical protein
MATVARAGMGNVVATPNTPDSATYAATTIVEVAHPTLTVDGVPVLASASCVFTATDNSTGATTSLPPVALSAGATKLTVASTGVLVNGDSASGAGGSVAVRVSTPPPLSTA